MTWLDRYSSNPFLRNLAVMFSGNGLALVIPFIIAPFITRLYTPSDFASFELFVKILALVSVVTSLRFELAIVLPKSDSESKKLTMLCIRILGVFIAMACLTIPFGQEISRAFNNQGLASLMWLFPLGIFVFGSYSILIQVAMRLNRFKLMAANKVMASAGNHGSKYLFGLIKPLPVGLVGGHVLGALISVLSLFRDRSVRSWFSFPKGEAHGWRSLMVKYRDFPIYNGSHAFYDEAYQTVLLLVISIGYGEYALGLFAFAYRYLRIPVQVFGASLSQVVFPRLSQMWNDGESLRPLIVKTMTGFLVVGIIPFGVLFLFGEEIFQFVFGEDWGGAGRYAAIMAPWLLANFAVSPISILPTVVQKQRAFFIVTLIITLCLLAMVTLMFSLDFDFETLLYALTAGNVFLNLFLFFWFLRIVKHKAPVV